VRRFRLPAILLATVVTVLSAFAAMPPASASSTVRYVALGDSYSSGDGAGSYSDGSCRQSANAYPELWHASHGGTFSNETCAGATTADVLSGQLGALSSSTTLVSITIGGNDVGFSGVMETCVLKSTSSCVRAVEAAEKEARGTLPASLDNVFAAIASDAPNAKVVVLGYPQFYDLSRSSSCIGLSTTDRKYLNRASVVLDGVVSAAAAKYGDSYVDPDRYFAGHQICDSGSYLNSVDWLDLTASYHPKASGQKDGYLPAIVSVTG
jgi:lysophospholipase L1-like esterase